MKRLGKSIGCIVLTGDIERQAVNRERINVGARHVVPLPAQRTTRFCCHIPCRGRAIYSAQADTNPLPYAFAIRAIVPERKITYTSPSASSPKDVISGGALRSTVRSQAPSACGVRVQTMPVQ